MAFCVINFSIVSPVVLCLVTELTDLATLKCNITAISIISLIYVVILLN